MSSALGSEMRFLESFVSSSNICMILFHSLSFFLFIHLFIDWHFSLLVTAGAQLSVLSGHKYIGEQVRCERTRATPAAWGLWLFQHRAAGRRNPIAWLWVTFKSAPGLCSLYQTSAGIFQCHFNTITTMDTSSELSNGWQSLNLFKETEFTFFWTD